MHSSSIAPFAEFVATLTKYPARLIATADGHGILHCTVGASCVRFQTKGRPDGVHPCGADSTLAVLQGKITGVVRIEPQDWMELDREYALFQHRSRGALTAALDACRQGRFDLAIRLCRLSSDDTAHQLAIVALAAEAHPTGGLPGAGTVPLSTLWAQRCVSEALPCLIANGVAAAQARLRRGVDEVMQQLSARGETNPGENSAVRRLAALASRLNGEAVVATSAAPVLTAAP